MVAFGWALEANDARENPNRDCSRQCPTHRKLDAPKAVLLEQSFTAVQLSQLVYPGLAKLRVVGRPKLFRVKITEARLKMDQTSSAAARLAIRS
jgi:hypothetical protein